MAMVENIPNEVVTDCRTEEGITIGLLDSMIFIARVLKSRNLNTSAVKSALRDLRNDEDIKSLLENVR